ncbi:RidA family protein [Kineosporia sp. J2-2]|uniref:RidA family protein n=1 Tax=Kineosporia corallincola TaxID=2835133 RepID=A0ABS5TA59_9ACTN|nr:RidA family protein [Kineosporia corallincola]MBT0767339.1 RidA family protein [Kineosporia corallincola]
MTGRIEARLTELGYTLPQVAAPVAAYVPAVLDGDRVYVSGQLPMVEGALPLTGRVGSGGGDGLISPSEANGLARVCALNALAAVRSAIGDLDRIRRIVKVVGFVASEPGFTGQPLVINGASEFLSEVFGPVGQHARSAIGVVALPLGAPVEVEMVVAVNP